MEFLWYHVQKSEDFLELILSITALIPKSLIQLVKKLHIFIDFLSANEGNLE